MATFNQYSMTIGPLYVDFGSWLCLFRYLQLVYYDTKKATQTPEYLNAGQ